MATFEAYKTLAVEIQGPVARLTLNRPPLNILDLEMIAELNQALGAHIPNRNIGVIVFAAAGEKAFSTGVDIKAHTPDKVREMLTSFHSIFRKLATAPQVSVALVRGYCLGGGCELATFCDFVIAEENAKFGVPEIEVGCFPPVAAAFYPVLLGDKRANAMILTGKPLTADEAKAEGLVNEVTLAGQLESTGEKWIAALSAKSRAVVAVTKRAMSGARGPAFLAALDHAENVYLSDLTRLDDMAEGLEAFVEKRKPEWTHGGT